MTTLINKATYSFLLSCLVVATTGGVFSYYLLRHIFDYEATEQLRAEQVKITQRIKISDPLAQNWFSLTDSLTFELLNTPVVETLSDTLFPNPLEKDELLPYRTLVFGVSTQKGIYKVTIQKAIYETENLTEAVFFIFGLLIVVLVLAMIGTNYLVANRLWRPFYQALEEIKGFKIQEENPLQFPNTDIKEFAVLQQNLDLLTRRIWHDFRNLKTFTENASHELQTPLAVISSRLEQMMQATNLNESQLNEMGHLIETIRQLSKLNQTLLLLAKIENRQFVATQPILLAPLIYTKLNKWGHWIQHRAIKITTELETSTLVEMNPFLADVLLNNLLTNAIKHNFQNGSVHILLNQKELKISNTGNKPEGIPTELWERFRKGSNLPDSHGLGLSLIKQICDTYGFSTDYTYENLTHIIIIKF